MAKSSAPSVPGAIGIHSLAFSAVAVNAGSTTTRRAPLATAARRPRLSKRFWFAPSMLIPSSMMNFAFS